jgi:RND family efflux transporter MFP subunit
MYKKLLIALGFVAIVSCSHKVEQTEDVKYVKMYTITSDSSSLGTTFHGIVHAEFEPNLSFRVAGKIISRSVDIGQQVEKDQVLAKLDSSDLQLSASSASSQLAAAKSAYLTQQANLARYKQLLSQNFVSQAQYDIQKAQFDNAKAQYEQAQNQVSNSNNQVNYTTLVAPSSGVITSIRMDAGQVVNAGQTVATMAVSGAKEVVVDIPETQINDFKTNMPAKIKIWALNKEFDGVIRVINSASDQDTRTFSARITINNPNADIKYGMAADVSITPLNNVEGIEVPLNSIYSNNGKSYVWKIDAKSQAELVEIKVLNTDGELAKITTNDLKQSDKIVAAGANFVHQGQLVKEY